MDNNSLFSKYFKSSEEFVSMILGLVIVLVAVGLVVNYFQKHRGVISVPGVSTQNQLKLAANDVPATPQTGNNQSEYTVKRGDSLWKIAETETGSGYNWTKIADANKIKNPGVLFKDQKLIIPKIEAKVAEIKKAPTVTIKPGTTYTVVKGDSLWKIAVKTYGDGFKWTQIWKTNQKLIRDPGKLEVGMKLALL